MLGKIEEFFCRQGTDGWAGGNNGQRKTLIIMGKRVEGHYIVIDDTSFGLRLVDQWGKDPTTGLPTGATIIQTLHYPHVPLWGMWYGLEGYEESALPFLRQTLRLNYNAGKSPRGPAEHIANGMAYRCSMKGDFSHFDGSEQVSNPQRSLGRHHFWGGSFLFLSAPKAT